MKTIKIEVDEKEYELLWKWKGPKFTWKEKFVHEALKWAEHLAYMREWRLSKK